MTDSLWRKRQEPEALKLAIEALELAQDNLRAHGENCFLHDEGEYNRCFCGKDSLSDHLQSVVGKLDEALAQPKQEHDLSEQGRNRSAVLGSNIEAMMESGLSFLKALETTLKVYDHAVPKPPTALRSKT